MRVSAEPVATSEPHSELIRELCDEATRSQSSHAYRDKVLELLSERIEVDAALFHELSPRVPLARAAFKGLDLAVLDSSSRGWDEMAVRLQPLLDVALRQSGAATDAEAFPRGSRSRRDWETRIAKPLGIRGLLIGHLLRHGRVISAVVLMRRSRGFSRAERVWLGKLLPCLTLGDSYWQFAGQQRFAGMLAAPICRDQRLTARQRQIVEGVALGRTNRQIAAALEISPHTVRNILVEICERLGAGNRADVVRLAVLSTPRE